MFPEDFFHDGQPVEYSAGQWAVLLTVVALNLAVMGGVMWLS